MTRLLLGIVLASLSTMAAAQDATPEPSPTVSAGAPETSDQGAQPTETTGTGDTEGRRWRRTIVPVRRNVAFVLPISLVRRGVSGGFERALGDARLALILRGMMAFPAGGDLRSVEFGASVEARFYVLGRGAFTRWDAPANVGLYLGARAGLMVTRLSDRRDGRVLGYGTRVIGEGTLGYRFTIVGRLEFTPFVGAMFYRDRVQGFASRLRPTPSFGFSSGVMF